LHESKINNFDNFGRFLKGVFVKDNRIFTIKGVKN